jgi:methylated-DNA-[protein]-cysteine S-methyltransferase
VFFCRHETPVGPVILAAREDGALTHLQFAHRFAPAREWREDATPLAETRRQLDAYFAGRRRAFDLPLAPAGTGFQRRVWRALMDIPYGTTITYGELARRVGNPRAARAVGAANGANAIAIIIPCHRVVAAGGIGGYGGGLEIKRRLLTLEGALC